MTDKKFQEAINEAAFKLRDYHISLAKAEKEYIRRYGVHPSDIDDDCWIDSLHVTGRGMTVKEVESLHN